MHTLPVSFALFTYTGYWRPVHFPVNSLKYWMYNLYSVFMIILLNTFVFCGLVDTFFMSTNLQELMDKCYMFFSNGAVSCKIAHLFIHRGNIIGLDKMLLKENCIPRDAHEVSIQVKFDRHARQVTIACGILNDCCAIFATFAQFHKLIETHSLPVYGWSPFDLSSIYVFMPMLLFQSVALLLCANSSVAHETLIAGMMIQICSQLKILCHRINQLPMLLMNTSKKYKSNQDLIAQERMMIRDLVYHHHYIYKFAHTVNTVFTLTMFVQFSVSFLVLCMSIYKISKTSLMTLDFVFISSYLCSMLMQIFLYCWYGNEVTLQSIKVSNAIYKMDWTVLRVRVMKDLLIMIIRAGKPIKISSGYMAVLTIESFMNILKISYSAYNFLKDS